MANYFQAHYHALVTLFFVVGALLTLGWKLVRCVRYEKTQGVKAKDALLDWFFSPTQDNAVSWVTTLGLIWCVGSIYINKITLSFLPDWADDIPVRIPFAFFIGSAAEWLAPDILKAVIGTLVNKVTELCNKIGGGSQTPSPPSGG